MADVVAVSDAPDRTRFEITVDGQLAGIARYVRRGNRVVFVHTEIDDRFEGQGLGSRLAAGALDAAREADDRVVPLCPFIASFIDKHPAYADLVDWELLAQFDESPDSS